MGTDPDDDPSDPADDASDPDDAVSYGLDDDAPDRDVDSAEPADEQSGVGYEVTDDEQTWGILAHAAAFTGLVIPFGNILGPLLVWLIKRDESRFVDENGKEAVNFQITWTVLMFFAFLAVFVAVGLVLVPLIALAWLILVVVGTARASDREVYDYPLTVDIVS